MGMTRRQFTKVGLGAGATLAFGGVSAHPDPGILKKSIPSSGETIPVIGVGTNRYGVGDDAEKRAVLSEARPIP